MSETLLRSMQLRELHILKDIIKICDRNDLRYFAIGGTCLGAVRHKGFIPWDDDIDIGMPRKDYEVFRKIAQQELPEYLELYEETTSRHNHCELLKVHDKNTIWVVGGDYLYNDRYTGIFVDIMHFDGLPDDPAKQKKHIRKVKRLLDLSTRFRLMEKPVSHNLRKWAVYLLVKKPLNAVLPWDYFHRKYDKEARKYDFDRSKYTYFSWSNLMEKRIFHQDLFDGYQLMDFEDTQIQVPAGYDEYLKIHYGDYREPPPKSERKTVHDQLIIDLEHSYKDYQNGRLELEKDGCRLHRGRL